MKLPLVTFIFPGLYWYLLTLMRRVPQTRGWSSVYVYFPVPLFRHSLPLFVLISSWAGGGGRSRLCNVDRGHQGGLWIPGKPGRRKNPFLLLLPLLAEVKRRIRWAPHVHGYDKRNAQNLSSLHLVFTIHRWLRCTNLHRRSSRPGWRFWVLCVRLQLRLFLLAEANNSWVLWRRGFMSFMCYLFIYLFAIHDSIIISSHTSVTPLLWLT